LGREGEGEREGGGLNVGGELAFPKEKGDFGFELVFVVGELFLIPSQSRYWTERADEESRDH